MKNTKTRRKFIKSVVTSGIGLPLLATGLTSCGASTNKEAQEESPVKTEHIALNILILGGTSFLGPHQVAYALERGHSVSIFTRGKSKPTVHQELFEQVEQLVGDRQDNLTALENRKWDVVIDNSGHNAEWTQKTAELLKENCDLYLYTSSTGVYYPYLGADYKEEDEVLLKEPEEIENEEEKIEYWYGVMKANSELEAIKHFGKERTIIVRPTYMIGPADKSNRFIHWPIRLSKGGEVLVPGKASDVVQYVDVRDVAQWMIRLIEEKKTGTFNAVGPKDQQTMYAFVEEAKQAFPVETTFVKIDDYDFLEKQEIYHIVPWIIPTMKTEGSAKVSNAKALANGLTFTPLVKTIKDTHEWWNSDALSQEKRDKVEQDPESVLVREKAILEAWKQV